MGAPFPNEGLTYVNIELVAGLPVKGRMETLVLGRYEDEPGLDSSLRPIDDAAHQVLSAYLGLGDFKPELNATAVLSAAGPIRRFVLVGLGKRAEVTPDRLRQAVASAVKAAREHHARHVSLVGFSAETDRALVQTLVEGIELGLYEFKEFKGKLAEDEPAPQLEAVAIGLPRVSAEAKAGLAAGLAIADSVNWARDLVNRPGGTLTATALADEVKAMAQARGLKCQVFGKAELETQGFGALLAVNAGSTQPPAFIIVEYMGGKKGDRPYALAGKGVTFDTGGLCIKPAQGMEEMKTDMGGAAAVFGAIRALADLKVPVNVVGCVSSTDNMPGSGSYRPGDILKTYSGLTIEVIDTDAEGRIVLSDALAYVDRNYDPKATIDLATLTGSIIIALGHHVTGLFSNDSDLSAGLLKASERTAERLWPMPIWEDYEDLVRSDIADVKNADRRRGDAIAAAKFLEKFAGKRPWAHLDIAGPSWAEEDRPYEPKGATGHGVRLLVDFLTEATR